MVPILVWSMETFKTIYIDLNPVLNIFQSFLKYLIKNVQQVEVTFHELDFHNCL